MGYGLTYTPYNTNLFLDAKGINPDAAAFIAAAGITGTTEVNAINNLVVGMKADGLWSKMKAVYPFVTDNRNLLSYTDTFSNAYWATGGGGLKTPNYATAPDGTMTACRVYNGGFFQSGGINKQASTYVFSFYVKMTSGTSGTIRVFLDGGFSTTTITVTNTWTRVEITKTFASIDTATSGFFIDSDVLIWQPQLELGSTATTYQPIATTQQAYIASQFKYNLVNPVDSDAAFRLVFNGGWTHSSTGATPNGTNAYADTKLVPSSVLTLNNTHLSFYSRTSAIVNGQRDIGVFVNGDSPCSSLGTNTGIQLSDAYNSLTNRISASIANALGFVNGTRTSSTSHKLFKNGTQIGTTDVFANVSSLPNQAIYIGAANLAPFTTTGGAFSTKQTAFSSAGDGLTDTEASNLYTRVQQFNTTLLRQV